MAEPLSGGRADQANRLPVDPDVDAAEDIAHPADVGPGVFTRAAAPRRPRFRLGVVVGVFCGGFLGGLARYAITAAWPSPVGFPWATFAVNTAGAFGLGLLLVLIAELWPPTTYTRPVAGTGFLGAFTTFSSVVVATDQLAVSGQPLVAVGYLAGSVLAGLAAAVSGLFLGRAITANRHRSQQRRRT